MTDFKTVFALMYTKDEKKYNLLYHSSKKKNKFFAPSIYQ